MQTIKQFVKIVDLHTWVVTGLALIVVFICRRLDFLVDLPTTLIGIAVVFPLVFSINSAYRRAGGCLKSLCQSQGARHGALLCPPRLAAK